ncbi:ATP-binding protein [Mycobacterium syngnathidarum]
MAYRSRVVDQVLDDLFPCTAAIAIEGAKGVGKTATAAQRAKSTLNLDDDSQRSVLAADLGLIDRLAPPVLIDEWQLLPSVWDRVRRGVDQSPDAGRFLLTGSAQVSADARIHSGAGRILNLIMRPMSIAERGLASPAASLHGLLAGGQMPVDGQTDVSLPDYAEEIVRSGFPGIRDLSPRARRAQLSGYVSRIVERELPDNGMAVRQPAALRAWLAAYGAATSTDAAYSVILDSATPGESDKPARQTVAQYREHLQRLFILDPISPWIPSFTPLKRLTKTPKHHLVDPALAATMAGIDVDALLGGTTAPGPAGAWLGALFESLVAQSIRVYAEAAEATVGHLRTQNGDHEIDLIVEGLGMKVIAIEVKLAATVDDKDVRHLNWLKAQIGDRLVDRVVVNTGQFAYRRPDGVAVVPLALFGP